MKMMTNWQLAIALATQEYKIASRTLQDVQCNVYMKRKMNPDYSDTAIMYQTSWSDIWWLPEKDGEHQ